MRSAFAHEALIELVSGAGERAPGAAVTVALCGHWEHEGTCRWPHRSSVDTRAGQSVRLRVVFACAASDEPTQGPSGLRASETALADRLTGI